MQVGEHVKALGSDSSQSFCHAGGSDSSEAELRRVRSFYVVVIIRDQS